MIQIRKPAKAPRVLSERGTRATRELCERSEAEPGGQQTTRFRSEFYAHRSVKDALRAAQHDKCALCESKITHIAYGDVEHYRPKAGYRQDPDHPLTRPGYYWLAYEWTNLLFCCQLCNQRFKGNQFPLLDPTRRARSHRDDIGQEAPLLINPAEEDPGAFLEFRENVIRAVDENPRGLATIRVFGLDRKELEERRLTHFLLLRHHIPLLIRTRDQIERKLKRRPTSELRRDLADLQSQLEQFLGDSAEYAAMIRAAFPTSRDGPRKEPDSGSSGGKSRRG